MFCSKCGAQSGDDARYCHGCGNPLQEANVGAQFTVASIRARCLKFHAFFRTLFDNTYRYELIGSGEGNVKIFAESEEFASYGDPAVPEMGAGGIPRRHLDKFVETLLAEGWEQMPPMEGDEWHEMRFKRRIY
ncbi:zinc ribbon domain-containing protein [Streptosporangium roseum]|uniref:zinc ribbon domain-containing protein n=1 Tax=Streptosporangium roseum TaxID=2001 RepID=UPI00331FC94C